jgi:hypothetical protein
LIDLLSESNRAAAGRFHCLRHSMQLAGARLPAAPDVLRAQVGAREEARPRETSAEAADVRELHTREAARQNQCDFLQPD